MGKTEDFIAKHMLSAASVDEEKTLDFILSREQQFSSDDSYICLS